MTVHVVLFRAYDSNQTELFLDKTPEEIHDSIFEICPTYVTIGILEFKEFELYQYHYLKTSTDQNTENIKNLLS